jgi:hypothetical protein
MICRHVSEGCRGCKLIPFSYENQLVKKRDFVQSCFDHLGLGLAVEAVVASPLQIGYRERASFVGENGVWGLRAKNNGVVATTECRVLAPSIVRELRGLKCLDKTSASFVCVEDVVVSSLSSSPAPLRVPLTHDGLYMYTHPTVFGQANRSVSALIAQLIRTMSPSSGHLLVKTSGYSCVFPVL